MLLALQHFTYTLWTIVGNVLDMAWTRQNVLKANGQNQISGHFSFFWGNSQVLKMSPPPVTHPNMLMSYEMLTVQKIFWLLCFVISKIWNSPVILIPKFVWTKDMLCKHKECIVMHLFPTPLGKIWKIIFCCIVELLSLKSIVYYYFPFSFFWLFFMQCPQNSRTYVMHPQIISGQGHISPMSWKI